MQRFQHGYSLVELLIAGSIGIFLMSAIVQVFSTSQTTVTLNQSMNEIQDRGRTLLNHMSFNLRQRGYQGCLPPLAIDINDVDDIDWNNTASVTPLATILPDTPYARTSLRAYEVDASGDFDPLPTEADIQAVQAGIDGVRPRPLSDVVHVQYGDRRSVNLLNNMTTQISNIELPDNRLGFEVGDLIMIGDCSNTDIIEITSLTEAPGLVTIVHNVSGNRSANLSRPYSTNATVRHFRNFTYFVGDSGRRSESGVTIYSLYRVDHTQTLVELVEGVDFLQLTYKQVLAGGVQETTPDDPVFDPLKVIGIDIGLLMVGTRDVLNAEDAKVYRLPGAAIGPNTPVSYDPNRKLKATFRTYIDLKNRA